MKNRLFLLCFLFSTPVFAQSSGIPWRNGDVLTANMLQSLDAAKMNLDSLGKPGFAPKLNNNGQITDPVVGDVSGATAASDGKTVSQIGKMAAGSVQKSDIGLKNSVAPTDANAMMSAPVSGDSSASPVSGIIAPGNAVFPSTVTRNVGAHFSDIPTLRDFGMNLAPLQGLQGISWLQNYWSLLDGATPAILPAGSFWPDNRYVPDSGSSSKTGFAQFPIVTAFGAVSNRPGYNTLWHYGVPYYGDVVPSLTHDDASFEFARVDGNFSSAGTSLPVVRVDQILDTPFEGGFNGTGGNQFGLTVNTTTTPRMSGGTISNINNTMISHGYNYWEEMDVNRWTHTRNNGTNWVWDNIQELYDETPFYCDRADSGLCFAEYMNEEDMYGLGPEDPASAYDPTKTNRQMFWLTTNHNVNHGSMTSLRWSAAMLVPAHKIITAVDSTTGHEYMFQGLHTGYVANSTTSITGTISGNTLTVTNTSNTITPGSTYIFGGTISDEVMISSQTSGTTGGAGVYTITSQLHPDGFSIPQSMTFSASTAASARFSVTGTKEPTWTFNTGDTFTDGTTTWTCLGPWQYDLGAIIKVGGSNDPSSGYVERIGTLMSEETDYIYNAIFDMSKAVFDPSITHVFARMQKDMYLDLTADGTSAGQNNALLGYNSAETALEYKRSGNVLLSVNDAGAVNIHQKISSLTGTFEIGSNAQLDENLFVGGHTQLYGSVEVNGPFQADQNAVVGADLQVNGTTHFLSQIILAPKTKAQILAISSPAEGMMVFNSDDHVTETYRCPPSGTCGWYAPQYEASPLSN